jgi:hypothetical protein
MAGTQTFQVTFPPWITRNCRRRSGAVGGVKVVPLSEPDRPNMIGNTERHARCAAQGLVHMAEIVERHMEADGGQVAFQALAETVAQPAGNCRAVGSRPPVRIFSPVAFMH